MTGKLKILHLEDMPTDAELVARELKRSSFVYELLLVDNKANYTAALAEFVPDIILSDHSLPSFNSIEALKILKRSGLNIPFILITATISEEFAVGIMKDGASDYILKDRMQRLPNAIINVLEKFKLEADRQKYMQEVIASEALLKEAENIADIGSLDFDLENQITKWSPGLYRILGLNIGDIEPTFKNFFNRIHADDMYRINKEIDHGIANLTEIILDFRVQGMHGNVKHLNAKLLVERNSRGQAIRVKGFAQDITKRKNADELIEKNHIQIQEASETQAAILNALPPNIVLLNDKGKIIAVNESWKKLAILNNLGMPNYGIGYNYLAISEKATGVDKINGNQIAQGIREVITGSKKEFTLEYESLTEKKWYQVVIAPLADKQKGVVILHINITDRKLAEASLLQSEANLRSVFENIDLSIILFDTDLKVISYNSNASEMVVKHFDKKIKTGVSAFNYCEKPRKSFLRQVLKRTNAQEMVFYEKAYKLKDGTEEWYDVKWVSVVNQHMEGVGIIVTLKNITDKKNAEIERETITSDLINRNKDLEQFTYIVSHNLRAPVANIQGLINLLNNFKPGEADGTEILKALSVSVVNLDKVILDLNHILQVRSQINDQIEVVSMPALIEEIRAGISQMMLKNKVSLVCDFAEIDKLFILKSYLYSIFQNLVINSIKYRRMDVDPIITISSKTDGNKACIYFQDNGKGIDLNKYGLHLFGLYKRFDWSVEGKGVGLFMVKMQVESLGGTISVQSELNKGTGFKIEFPITQSS